ncbi:MAG: RimK/LysX family protein [Rudaea sp.]|nr:RimK/LysX family protein [Rudaea sp.]
MHEHPLIGWREWLVLPQLGLGALKAKIDTGARSSSLHVNSISECERDGRTWLRFAVATRRRGGGLVACEAPACDRRDVTDSGGHITSRWFIRTAIRLGGIEWETELNLTNRCNMLFPMLLGRSALCGRFRVDPQLSFVCGRLKRRVHTFGATS